MANFSHSFFLPKQIAGLYFKLLKVSKNLHQAASSIAFIGKCLQLHITPKFASVNGQFVNQEDKTLVERQIMASHMMQHITNLKLAMNTHGSLKQQLAFSCGKMFANMILKRMLRYDFLMYRLRGQKHYKKTLQTPF